MRIKKFGVAAVLAIAILASTGTCFALKKSDMNIGGIYFGQPIEKVIAKMGKNGDVSTEVLRKICKALDCGLDDIVEIIPDDTQF